jgi:hypothetical protein
VVIVVAVAVVAVVAIVALSLRGREIRADKRIAQARDGDSAHEPPKPD